VIDCWTEGVQLIKVGGKAQLICPPQTAYGRAGSRRSSRRTRRSSSRSSCQGPVAGRHGSAFPAQVTHKYILAIRCTDGLAWARERGPGPVPTRAAQARGARADRRGRLELFRARGFADTKVSEICERADVAHKTFFNHFPSKQDLVREIAQHSIGELLIDIETARKAGANTADRIARFFAGMARRSLEAARCSARW
jgi:hypothetical protein